MDEDCFVVVRPSALRGAKHRGMYLRHGLQINTVEMFLWKMVVIFIFQKPPMGPSGRREPIVLSMHYKRTTTNDMS